MSPGDRSGRSGAGLRFARPRMPIREADCAATGGKQCDPYVVPALIGVVVIATLFQEPAEGEVSEPFAISVPGCAPDAE